MERGDKQDESTSTPPASQTEDARSMLEQQQEQKNIRRLQIMMNMIMSVIAQDSTLSYEDAAEMVADSRRAALAMFPDKALAYDLIYKPRLQRLMRDRFRLQ